MKTFHTEILRVGKGHHRRIDIRIARLPSHTLIDMPVFVYKGKQPGPNLLLTAGIHGDEINGVMILRKLITEKSLQPDKGTVIAIPLVNVYGFLQASRAMPDGKDLNRSFPGATTGSLANQIAYILMHEIIPFIDIGVDFHTGGSRISNYPQIRCVIENARNLELAHYFAPPFILNSNLIDKSFRKEAFKAGKTILVYEGGESLRLDELSIQEGMEGVKRLMHHLGMKNYEQALPEKPGAVLRKTSWLRAKVSGLFDANIQYGEKIRKGQIIAHITDPYGRMKTAIKSPKEGYVVGLNNMPIVNAGDALVHIGN